MCYGGVNPIMVMIGRGKMLTVEIPYLLTSLRFRSSALKSYKQSKTSDAMEPII